MDTEDVRQRFDLTEFDAWLAAEKERAWNEGKQAMIEYSQGARRKVPYPVNPYKKEI